MENNALPVNGTVETCRTVFPAYDIGHWCDLGVAHAFAYATIERPGYSELRVLHLNNQDGLSRHYIRMPE